VVETGLSGSTQIYQLRAMLRGIGPLIWRRLLVRSDSTGARLHEVLQIALRSAAANMCWGMHLLMLQCST
jgi:hypothetical protein